ncbi:short-chain dehydrogenase, putative [Talaromyces stipitatus ATCC 10500]|uniref:Short-chain dehydrogenase, putative n=1 Tax=Talaromyces stipitatus (strain ATCC 10500 / CBS 375.48 / QM 6759 / NRRL 1006) TaxID=441959 RepID=B8M0I3_TALSN|nr:short-chain dehydrogenase, putative [Talaromyces stipitatus ATCC 10500]EED21280.1 short-chain dehydrogenase, putative [Talaromyces stipitatus ATCC 10500]
MSFIFHRKITYNPDKDIPDLESKVILVTGGNNGLGKETVKELAKHNPTKIYMGARSKAKASAAIAELKEQVPSANIIYLEINLASFSSIKRAAATFLAENDRLHILVNNAGVFATPPGLTEDGYEVQFGTNYMGPALFTKLLLPILEKTASISEGNVRIINISSEIYKLAPKGGLLLAQDKTPLTEISTVARYGQCKLANIYFTKSYAKRYPAIKSVALHPGLVQTNIGGEMKGFSIMSLIFGLLNRVSSVDVATGALNQLWASTFDAEKVNSGAYYIPFFKESNRRDITKDEKKMEELWEWTEKEFKEHGLSSKENLFFKL